ncbi:phosphohistidine phosphatase, SixA [Vibrio xiamenensis]|uniref:Phosphohistidine phosphatase, SixA n=1 Tax=Vibrio xiamenensis TaxID=861298 RepID=A0A1G8EMH9_9VIBR|nr:phosphohistidine phosphatase SixA [Vibrio xiamenensis]SDH71086.1 phosphohistidine phosphatase, SixA [Vibrio xiamenensis]
MKIFIMRHGEAEHFALSDAQRALTERGQSDSIAVARACNEQGTKSFDRVFVSSYLRAQQTWQAIAPYFDAKQVDTSDDITPYGDSEQVYEFLKAVSEIDDIDSILVVSHLPLVGYLTAEFVADLAPPMFPTSGLTYIEFDAIGEQGNIVWSLHP